MSTITATAPISQVGSKTHNPLANVWLGALTLVFTLFISCTLALVAWPVIAWFSERQLS